MGNDGGSIPKRVDLVKTKRERVIGNKKTILKERFKSCAFTNQRLKPPVVVCRRGFIFNKESLLKSIIKKDLPEELKYIRKLKDIRDVKISANLNKNSNYPLICPLTGKELNGINNFICNWNCGCLLFEKMMFALANINFGIDEIARERAKKSKNKQFVDKLFKCPNCSKEFSLMKLLKINMQVDEFKPKIPDALRQFKKKMESLSKKNILGKRNQMDFPISDQRMNFNKPLSQKIRLKAVKSVISDSRISKWKKKPKPEITEMPAVMKDLFHLKTKNETADELIMRDTKHGLR